MVLGTARITLNIKHISDSVTMLNLLNLSEHQFSPLWNVCITAQSVIPSSHMHMHTCERTHTRMLVRASQGCIGGVGAGWYVEKMLSIILFWWVIQNILDVQRKVSQHKACHGLQQCISVGNDKDKSFIDYAHFFPWNYRAYVNQYISCTLPSMGHPSRS